MRGRNAWKHFDNSQSMRLTLSLVLLTCYIEISKTWTNQVHQTVDWVFMIWCNEISLRCSRISDAELVFYALRFVFSGRNCFLVVHRSFSPANWILTEVCLSDLCVSIKTNSWNETESQLKHQTWLTWQMKCISFCSSRWSLTSLWLLSMDSFQSFRRFFKWKSGSMRGKG